MSQAANTDVALRKETEKKRRNIFANKFML